MLQPGTHQEPSGYSNYVCEPHLSRNYMEYEPKWKWAAAYEVTQCYGGPEEGGWWFQSGHLVEAKRFPNRAQAWKQVEAWRKEKYPSTGKQYSVIGGEDYDCWVEDEYPADFFPTERPFYE